MQTVDKKKFKAQAHALNPVVMIGHAGFTAAVLAEIEIALNSHELIKIRIRAEREERKLISEKICQDSGATLIQAIGQIVVVYRPKPKN
ncbi:ribosome assembly RNA-binding protein YhbY [Crenothrix polyspora]|jgi:RNA-binding protein|uniref:Putative RNA-binding protein n=1 Tax=Crenothrix polyspora TaxID=360316 RepID=A0A1R4HJL3_9GAMM|nr:ribosome assembly RNA-binding protein YhbY [Crenothrix polyspora]SJM96409.1 putative RNA-binding protein [Crenothrix polyspora]